MKLFQTVRRNWILFLPVVIVFIFFNRVFLYSEVPFPGDLLVGHYEPYKSYSYLGIAPGGVPHKAQGVDVVRQLAPWKKFTVDSFKNFQVPLWNPYNFSGNPLMANLQSGVFYPVNLVFILRDFWSAWSAYIILIPILAAVFTYVFLRRLKISPVGSMFGGLAFAFSSYMTVWLEWGNIGHTFIWLPLVLYFSDKLLERISYKDFIGLTLSCLIAFLAGYVQGVFYIYITAFAYFFLKGKIERKIDVHKSLFFILSTLLALLVGAFQLFPTLELFVASTRGNYTLKQIEEMLNPLYYLVTVFAPDFFGNPATRNYWLEGTYIERVSYFGLIPTVLAVFAICTVFRKVEVKIFSVLMLISLLISTDIFITRFFYLIPIPVISTTVVTRALSIFAFSGCVLAAFGFDRLLLQKKWKQLNIITCCILIIFGVLIVATFIIPKFVATDQLVIAAKVAQRNLILPIVGMLLFLLAFTLFFINKLPKKILTVAIFAIAFFDLFYYFAKLTPFSPREFLYPSTPVVEYLRENAGINRSWGYGTGYYESNLQTFEGIFSTEGYDPLHIKDYAELVSASSKGTIPDELSRTEANIAGGFGREELAGNEFRQKALDIMGVKYLLERDDSINGEYNPDYVTFPDDRFKLVWQKGYWQIYENLKVTPRFFVTNKYRVEKDKTRALKTLYGPDFDEREELVLSQDPKIPHVANTNSSRIISYTPNKVVIEASTSARALFFLSDTYYPGWKSYVNGRPTKIYLADYAFRAVEIPAGASSIVFEYRPSSFYYGLYIAGVAIVLLFYCATVIKKKYAN